MQDFLPTKPPGRISRLTDEKYKQALIRLWATMSPDEIAKELGVSRTTIDRHAAILRREAAKHKRKP